MKYNTFHTQLLAILLLCFTKKMFIYSRPIKTIFVCLTLFLPATHLYARLGESGEEIANRFGKEEILDPEINNTTFAVSQLREALCGSIGIQKAEMMKPTAENRPAFVGGIELQVATMMDALNGWKWERVKFKGYRHGAIRVLVILLDDKSVFENYLRATPLDKQEMDTLLTSNSDGSNWQEIINAEDQRFFQKNPELQTRNWRIVNPTTNKPSRLAIARGTSDLSVYATDIALYCETAVKTIAEEKKKSENVKGF